MLQLDFVLYRFVCDISTFTGLFAEDGEGRCIPDTAAFHCTWSRTPRTKHAAAGATERFGGCTENLYFKALGSDMALTFTTQQQQMVIDGEREVITFALRPSQYSVEGALPMIAKGTLDPGPYFDKPRKNYAIKLRDAAGQVAGKLLFALLVHEVEEEDGESSAAPKAVAPSPKSPLTSSLENSRLSLHRNPARDRLLKSPPTKASVPSSSSGSPPRTGDRGRVAAAVADADHAAGSSSAPPPLSTAPSASGSGGLTPRRSSPPPSIKRAAAPATMTAPPPPSAAGATTAPAHTTSAASSATAGSAADNSPKRQQRGRTVQSLDVQLERITVKSECIDLVHPAPLLLGGDYSLRIRYGSYAYNTTRCICCNPKEVQYNGQQACITLQPNAGTEKLRFSLWEDKRQVAGFSLDPAKFKADAGVWKEYAIPFRYHPTGQKAALDVRVRRLVVPIDSSPASRRGYSPAAEHRQPTMETGATEPIAFLADPDVPRRLTYQQEQASSATRGAQTQTPLRKATTSPKRHHQHHDPTLAAPASPASPPPAETSVSQPARSSPLAHRTSGKRSPPGSIIVTGGLLPSSNAGRDHTPHRVLNPTVDRSVHSGCRNGFVPEDSEVRSGWERTPMRQRPPPLTQNLADMPADCRPPDDHEKYISEVLARLNRQQRGASRQHTSLVEEWMGWRDERERSRCNSAANSQLRSESVSSALSRADSVASIVSRHASAPRATRSNADFAVMAPFTPDSSARRRRSSPSPAARNPLV